jgi:hypothetical protein
MPAAVPIKVCNHYMAKRASGLSQEAAAAASRQGSLEVTQKPVPEPVLASPAAPEVP